MRISKNQTKIVILCGGYGSRLGHETKLIPKPMVKIDNDPILVHILRIYKKYNFNNFILALGYKGHVIKKYFKKNKEFKIKMINTGLNSLTGTRLYKLKKYLKLEENFMLTYGDGVSDVNIKNLLNYHIKKKKIGTMTVVRPPVRFGEVKLKNNQIINFREKPQIKNNWINGGFFVFNNKIFNYLRNKNEMLEKAPLEKLANHKKLVAFKHQKFWQCMDTTRDKEYLKDLLKKNKAKWK